MCIRDRVRVGSPEDLFACGLLAQIGRLALITAYPVDYAALLERQDGGVVLIELERQHLGTDRRELTAVIMADCGIPTALAEPVSHHDDPDASGFSEGSRPYQLAHLFFQARRMADLGLSPATERYGSISELMRLGSKIGLDASALGEVFDRVVAQWHEWAEVLKVPAGDLPSFEAMAEAPAYRPGHESKATRTRTRVLLVESDSTTRMMTEEVLSRILGCTVHVLSIVHI